MRRLSGVVRRTFAVILATTLTAGSLTLASPAALIASNGPDTEPPRLRWIGLAPEPRRSEVPFEFSFGLRDASPKVQLRLEISDVDGDIVAVLDGIVRAPGDRRIRWDGASDDGRQVVPGLYHARLTARDAAGNERTGDPLVFRDHHPVSARVFSRLEGTGDSVAIALDDCTSAGHWRNILRSLAGAGAHASFFCGGYTVTAFPRLARRTVRDGHSVGSHSYDHIDLTKASRREIASQLRREQRVWWKAAQVTPAPYFRPPHARLDRQVEAAVGRQGYPRIVLWDVVAYDYAGATAAQIRRRVLRQIRPGSITLLHVLGTTARAMPGILDGLSEMGLRSVTLDELFEAAHAG